MSAPRKRQPPKPAPAAPVEASVEEPRVCADCGSSEVEVSQGAGDAERWYCRRDRPANAP